MIDIALPVASLAVFLSAYTLVRLERTRPVPVTAAMCPCGHAINFHVKLSGTCAAFTRVPTQWNDLGHRHPIKWREFRCDCQVYAGPELLRGLFTNSIMDLPELPKDDPT